MKIKYDEETDAIFFILSEKKIVESEEITKGVIVDYDDKDQLTSIEILNFRSRKEELNIPRELKVASYFVA